MNTPQPIEHLFEKIRHLPADRVTEVADFVDFLSERGQRVKRQRSPQSLDFPVISAGPWPQDLSLGREEMYDDDGR